MFTKSRSDRSIAQRNQLRAGIVSISAITTITYRHGTITITTSITGEGRCG